MGNNPISLIDPDGKDPLTGALLGEQLWDELSGDNLTDDPKSIGSLVQGTITAAGLGALYEAGAAYLAGDYLGFGFWSEAGGAVFGAEGSGSEAGVFDFEKSSEFELGGFSIGNILTDEPIKQIATTCPSKLTGIQLLEDRGISTSLEPALYTNEPIVLFEGPLLNLGNHASANNNMLFLTMDVKEEAKKTGIGRAMVEAAIDIFQNQEKIKINGIRGIWGEGKLGDNYKTFRENEIKLGQIEAAFQTATGKIALKLGYSDVRILRNDKGIVETLFTKPGYDASKYDLNDE